MSQNHQDQLLEIAASLARRTLDYKNRASIILRASAVDFIGMIESPKLEDIQAILQPFIHGDEQVAENVALILPDVCNCYVQNHPEDDWSELINLIQPVAEQHREFYPVLEAVLWALKESND